MIVPQNGCYMTRTIHANQMARSLRNPCDCWGRCGGEPGREWVRLDAFGPRIGFNPGADVFYEER
jgi:hypothetical protein